MMAARDEVTTVWIKQEEMEDLPNNPASMAIKDLLDIGETSFHVKQEHEFMHHVDDFEHNAIKDPLYIGPSFHVKQEHEFKHNVDDFEHNAIKDPLYIGPRFHVKQEHEFHHNVDSEHNVATTTGCESGSTRLIQHSSESCYISSEETVKQEVVPGNMLIGAVESTSFTMFGIHTQHTEEDNKKEEENSLFGIRLKCSSREKEFSPLSCSFCLQNFPSKYGLIMHVFIHIDGVEPPTYVCKSCGEVFCSDVILNRHVKMSAGVPPPFDGHNYKFEHLYNHENIVEGDQEVSFKSFTELDTLKRHELIHTGSVPHKCGICGKSFTQLCHLKTHSLTHTGSKPHKCGICGKSFTQLCHLKTHSLTHTGSQTDRCDVCGKSFIGLGYLKTHSLIHTGIKPHKCDICGKSFTHLASLKHHSFIHTGSRPHKCGICDKSFTQLGSLKMHSLTHTGSKPHKCDVCGKSFTQLGNLKTHSLTHTGSKPHKCDVCGKSFTQMSSLKHHSFKHS